MAYNRARKTGLLSDWDKFKRYRNLYKNSSRSMKKVFFKKQQMSKPIIQQNIGKSKIYLNSSSSIFFDCVRDFK